MVRVSARDVALGVISSCCIPTAQLPKRRACSWRKTPPISAGAARRIVLYVASLAPQSAPPLNAELTPIFAGARRLDQIHHFLSRSPLALSAGLSLDCTTLSYPSATFQSISLPIIAVLALGCLARHHHTTDGSIGRLHAGPQLRVSVSHSRHCRPGSSFCMRARPRGHDARGSASKKHIFEQSQH